MTDNTKKIIVREVKFLLSFALVSIVVGLILSTSKIEYVTYQKNKTSAYAFSFWTFIQNTSALFGVLAGIRYGFLEIKKFIIWAVKTSKVK